MNIDSENHSEVSELLPWYINGTLERDKTSFVRKHLAVCNECRDDYAFLQSVDVAVNKSSPAPIVPQPPVESFLAHMDASEKVKPGRDHRPAWAIAASLVLVFVLALSLFGERTTTEIPNRFETATTASNTVSMDYVLRIDFEKSTAKNEHASVIESFGGRNVVAERNGYKVVVSVPALTLEEAEDFITTSIEARPEVRSVEIVALQLPVRNE